MYDVIEIYKNGLAGYSSDRLRRIPKPGVWSLGQLYDHVIAVAFEYLGHIADCAKSAEAQPAGKTPSGEELFRLGGFPPVRIKLPDTPEFTPSNEESKEALLAGLERVERAMREWELRLASLNPDMKEQHAGYGWLNAAEWFAMIGMHSRHHLRQKAELELLTQDEA